MYARAREPYRHANSDRHEPDSALRSSGGAARATRRSVVDHILRLRAEIDAYTGLSDYLLTYGPPTDEPRPSAPPAATNGPTIEGTAPAVR